MKEIEIKNNDSGQRMDKYLHKLLPNAADSFLYKMLRKKNILLNGKKAQGKELLTAGDHIRIYFSEETFLKFSRDVQSAEVEFERLRSLPMAGLRVLYEDADILALDKPADMLSQKARSEEPSANEYMIGYLIREGALCFDDFVTFRPSVCNRLDRNTTGILLAGKTLAGLQRLSEQMRSREARKYYHAIVAGVVAEPGHLRGYLSKDRGSNRVSVHRESGGDGNRWIETSYRPLRVGADCTLLEIHLITGRSHQIRAHMAAEGYPVVGDVKYGDPEVNRRYRERFHVNFQLLHACRVELPGMEPIIAKDPDLFQIIVKNKTST